MMAADKGSGGGDKCRSAKLKNEVNAVECGYRRVERALVEWVRAVVEDNESGRGSTCRIAAVRDEIGAAEYGRRLDERAKGDA